MFAQTANFIPSGIIVAFTGLVTEIPVGWALCNGDNGTPDLRSRFLRAEGGSVAHNETGGGGTHTHLFTATAHSHNIEDGNAIQEGTYYGDTVDSQVVSGETQAEAAMPPYFAKAFIMKL